MATRELSRRSRMLREVKERGPTVRELASTTEPAESRRFAESHRVELAERVDHVLIGSPIRHRAECDCGWVGDWRPTAVGAGAEGNQHQALAARGWDV